MSNSMIGGVQFMRLDGAFPYGGYETELYSHPGIAGEGSHMKGWRGHSSQITGVQAYTSSATRRTARRTCEALRGTVVTAYDNNSNAEYFMLIQDVSCDEQDMLYATDSKKYHLAVRFTVRYLGL